MAKILRKYTTIPKHLYVRRNADTQLQQIIEEMDRPGYVLVARQMGKTNLLFNAKRDLENEGTRIVYIDLSNVFDDERECYRNIIDLIIDSNEDYFLSAIEEIHEAREKANLPPHKEHIKELRKILNAFKGKIVIILDEIDALRTATYSDKIFAQIRSNYFARTNYPEFENLTYVLSGVIEPTELIKDRNKSPFNIGEKIYLDDFTFKEHQEFVNKSKLKINEEQSAHIYNWAKGNPRLTFDICSAIEEYLIQNEIINFQEIDEIIEKKYLTNYDVAPIDHIRELVVNNQTVRNAIYSLRKGNRDISTEIKSKLYLFGIINSDFINVSIKNKIIDLSLSEEWLMSVNKQTKSLFEIGSQSIMNGIDIDGGIATLKEYLDSDLNIQNALKQLSIYYIGYGYHVKKEYSESNKYLLQQFVSCDNSTDLHYRQKLFIGLNYLKLNDFENAEKYLNEIISDYPNSPPYLHALLNLAASLIEKNFEEHKEKAKELLTRIIKDSNSIEIVETEKPTINEFKVLAFYYMADILEKEKDTNTALSNIDNAIQISDNEFLPELYCQKFFLTPEDTSILFKIFETIETNQLKFSGYAYELSFTEYHLYKYLSLYRVYQENVLFDNLFKYALSSLFSNKKEEYELYFSLAQYNNRIHFSNDFYEDVIKVAPENAEIKIIYESYRNLALNYLEKDSVFEDYFDKYVTSFKTNETLIELDDISTFARAVRYYSDRKNIDKGLELCDTIYLRLKSNSIEDSFESLIIYYWYCNLYYSKKDNEKAILNADKTINIINRNKDKQKRGSIIDEKGLKTIYEQMIQIKNSLITKKPVIVGKKYGRNDIVRVKYIDGAVVKGKYKRLEADIIAERCKII